MSQEECRHEFLADPRKAGTQYCRLCFKWSGDATEEWISVKERLPGLGPVFSRVHSNTPYVAQFINGIWYDMQGQDRSPSHWMAIPEHKPEQINKKS